jgi:hypothetical protein
MRPNVAYTLLRLNGHRLQSPSGRHDRLEPIEKASEDVPPARPSM